MIASKIAPIDNFFNRGIPDGILIDVFGASGTGKSQLVLQTAVHTAALGKSVLFHDTTGAFRPERMLEIARSGGLNAGILDNVAVYRITNASEQMNSLSKIRTRDFSCLIIDNVSELFSFEYSDRGQFAERNRLFLKYMRSLSLLSTCNNLTVLLTNVVRNSDGEQIENFEKTVDLFTHVKIRLELTDGYRCTCYTAFERKSFDFEITRSGISPCQG